MSLSRYALLTLVAGLTVFSTDAGAIAAQSPQIAAPTGLFTSSVQGNVAAKPAPCCGTIVGDD